MVGRVSAEAARARRGVSRSVVEKRILFTGAMSRLCADWLRWMWSRPVGRLCCRVTMHWNVGSMVCCVNSELCADSQRESVLTATATARFLKKVSQRWSVESVVCWRNVSDSQSASVVSDMVARRPGCPTSSSRRELNSRKECGLYGVRRRRRRERVSKECECRVGRSLSSSPKQSSVSKLDGGKEGLRTRVAGGRAHGALMQAWSPSQPFISPAQFQQAPSASRPPSSRRLGRQSVREGVCLREITPQMPGGVWDNTISR